MRIIRGEAIAPGYEPGGLTWLPYPAISGFEEARI